MPDLTLPSIIVLIGIALSFDFANGFHDAANSIATIVSTRVLTPLQGVMWAAFFNFVAAFTFGTAIAKTVGSGLIDVHKVDNIVILAGLIGAIAWDLITWYYGLPTSSSHALIGGYAGAAVAKAGLDVIIWRGWDLTILFIFVAPLIGFVLGGIFMVAIFWLFRQQSPASVDHLFRRGQLLSAAAYSLGHGTNDAQKTMGIIAGILFSVPQYRGLVTDASGAMLIPFWIVLMCHAAMGLGTLSGGWRIVHTMGNRITKLLPMGGFAAEAAGAITIFLSANLGIPVSTTHTIAGAITGVGTVRGLRAVRWGVASSIVWAWILTIPAAGLMAAASWLVLNAIHGIL